MQVQDMLEVGGPSPFLWEGEQNIRSRQEFLTVPSPPPLYFLRLCVSFL